MKLPVARTTSSVPSSHPLGLWDCKTKVLLVPPAGLRSRRVTTQLTVHHKRTMYILEPTKEARAAAKKARDRRRVRGRARVESIPRRGACRTTVSQGWLRHPRRDRGKQTPERCPHRDSQATATKGTGARQVRQDQARAAHRARPIRRHVAPSGPMSRTCCPMPYGRHLKPSTPCPTGTSPPIHRVLSNARRPARCGPPCPMVTIWERTCELGRTTGHLRPVLTSELRGSSCYVDFLGGRKGAFEVTMSAYLKESSRSAGPTIPAV